MPPKKNAIKKKPAKFVFEFADLALIGQAVRKEFEGAPPAPLRHRSRAPPDAPGWPVGSGHGIFPGRVSKVDKATGYFTVAYEDGDNEELQREELQKLLAKSAKLPPAAVTAPPRSSITAKVAAARICACTACACTARKYHARITYETSTHHARTTHAPCRAHACACASRRGAGVFERHAARLHAEHLLRRAAQAQAHRPRAPWRLQGAYSACLTHSLHSLHAFCLSLHTPHS